MAVGYVETSHDNGSRSVPQRITGIGGFASSANGVLFTTSAGSLAGSTTAIPLFTGTFTTSPLIEAISAQMKYGGSVNYNITVIGASIDPASTDQTVDEGSLVKYCTDEGEVSWNINISIEYGCDDHFRATSVNGSATKYLPGSTEPTLTALPYAPVSLPAIGMVLTESAVSYDPQNFERAYVKKQIVSMAGIPWSAFVDPTS